VSHGDPILVLVGTMRGLPLDTRIFPRPYLATGTVFRLRFDARGVCHSIEEYVPHAEAAA
jgi:broad specificity phosphatase PhoE